jgi:hypothetical protein
MESYDDVLLNDLSNYLDHNNATGINAVQDPPGQTSNHEFSLPPADCGKAARLFLAAEFVVEALVWGQLKSLLVQIAPTRLPPI